MMHWFHRCKPDCCFLEKLMSLAEDVKALATAVADKAASVDSKMDAVIAKINELKSQLANNAEAVSGLPSGNCW